MRYIDVKDLTFYYDDEPVLEDISYHVDDGEFVILTGENGAAKSTLIKATLGLLKPSKGDVVLAKESAAGEKISIGYIPQQVASFNAGFPSTVEELVRSGRYPRGRWFKRLSKKDHEHVQKALEAVGMWEMRHKKIGELSGGQKQRISLARIFATDPDLFILDEPTTGMDEQSRNEFYRLLRHSAHQHGKAILMITHDHEDIKQYADRQIRLVRKEDSPWRCFHIDR
ncbi:MULTISPECIES: metal ABC transporter ATP-binding protein [Enterococcus]|uniref:ABC transporter ATP-binding protein n=1 Tax=Enterococcus dispar ATCC 51266 TaxID=1139219 RepID=S0K6E3_9ENTE|nr:metal ABC transporter ATP-binding protein [Enterococcus dispar]EOT40107.1 ABC transporter ATP-binding protein [Enterococcus dispar ATCC 51266]EOW86610.1 ABC transporter ATP-binding protein [Enterococcus dispar ATCC 51266]MCU7357523.1 metal ABC transporter ATP-binding protein [Enterococcus dispar]OJG39424.1 ABC transporter ATP-binding protein [Enterococcus dispar]WCG31922.1 metal ABC transporter ATP-binding protein [Enterococcus dispar]